MRLIWRQDLISYGIDQTAPISMSEAVEGTGKSHAEIYVDCNQQDL